MDKVEVGRKMRGQGSKTVCLGYGCANETVNSAFPRFASVDQLQRCGRVSHSSGKE